MRRRAVFSGGVVAAAAMLLAFPLLRDAGAGGGAEAAAGGATAEARASTTVSAASLAPIADPAPARRTAAPSARTTLGRGGTLQAALGKLGHRPAETAPAIAALTESGGLDPRGLRRSTEVVAWSAPDAGLRAVAVPLDEGRTAYAKRSGQGWSAALLTPRLSPEPFLLRGEIDTSLYASAAAMGGTDHDISAFAEIFGFEVDFQRQIRPGDRFEMVVTRMVDERGAPVRDGPLLYAALDGDLVSQRYYLFDPGGGGGGDEGMAGADGEGGAAAAHFSPEGRTAARFLMKTPVNGARLSSAFGMRRHPISGFSRLHKGTDFAAPSGTPVFAAGSGTVERSSRYGGYGNYVRLRHANGYKTAYAHLRGYGPGIRRGASVSQGQIIGYVGSTGASTGPHLHYEVYRDGEAVNVMTLDLPPQLDLSDDPDAMTAFARRMSKIDRLRRELLDEPLSFAGN